MSGDDWQDSGFATAWDASGNLSTNPDRARQLALLADLLVAVKATRLVDLGIGSAQVESAIQRRHPAFFDRCQVIGIDGSEAMLDIARARLGDEKLPDCRLMTVDFEDLDSIDLPWTPDAMICVQALHEVPHAVKRAVFQWAKGVLKDGSPFLILDRFAYPQDGWMAELEATWDWMRSSVVDDVLDFGSYHRRYSAKADHVASVEDYLGWLTAAGFEVLCPYRCFNRALIVARA